MKSTSLGMKPNGYLTPLAKAKPGRPLRKAVDLWEGAGAVLIAERLRLNTGRVAAVRLDTPVVSNVWWPVALKKANADAEKALVVWLNSSLGLLMLLAHREETEGAWIDFKKPILLNLPVLDVLSLSPMARKQLAKLFDTLQSQELQPLPKMSQDKIREQLDAGISKALGLPDLQPLRDLIGQEPVVCLAPLYD